MRNIIIKITAIASILVGASCSDPYIADATPKDPGQIQTVNETNQEIVESNQSTHNAVAPQRNDTLALTWNIIQPNAEFRITNEQSLPFDVDCDGDGIYEKTNITGHYTCVYTEIGTYQTTIKGPLAKQLTISPNNAIINPKGMTLETRFPAPNGYYRLSQVDPGYASYLHSLPMLPDGSPVLLFNGSPKEYQNSHVAVLDIDVGKRDLQQCADAAMRLRTEYLFASNQHSKMVYHFSNGLKFSWPEWRDGARLVKNDKGKRVMIKKASINKTYNNYRSWLDILMMYANVDSMMKDSKPLSLDDMAPGDVFASRGNTYNHLIIVIDVVTSPDGSKKFLLAQSYMPAQQIEILKNPYNSSTPWYSSDDVKHAYQANNSFITPEWEFPAPGPNLFRMP